MKIHWTTAREAYKGVMLNIFVEIKKEWPKKVHMVDNQMCFNRMYAGSKCAKAGNSRPRQHTHKEDKMIDIIEKMKTEMFRRKYSIRTIKAYCDVVNTFLRKTKTEDIRRIRKNDVKDYLNTLSEKAGNTINVHLNALKFMMEEILHKNCYVHIKYSKIPKRIPEYLTKDEIINLFNAIDSPKHKLMIKLMYSAGFRLSELVNLNVCNFDFEENAGWVRGGKGNKDRAFIVAESLKYELLKFIAKNKLNSYDFIFRGRNGKISNRTVQEILKRAGNKAGIFKHVHPHMLRHSFAAHLVKEGVDLFTVQSLLGHSDVKTTQIYAHAAKPKLINVKSPLDSIIAAKY